MLRHAVADDEREVERRSRRVHRRREPGDPVNVQSGSVNASSDDDDCHRRHADGREHAPRRLLRAEQGSSYTNAVPASMAEMWDVAVDWRRVAASRTTSRAADEAYAGTVATGNRNGTSAAAAINIGQLIALAPLAVDGSGTLTTPTTNVAASSAGNTLTFTYTAATGGMRNGSVTLVVPTGWSAPSTTGTAAGYTTASTGTVGVAGQTITVSGADAHRRLHLHRHVRRRRPAAAPARPRPRRPARRPGRRSSARRRSAAPSSNLGASPSVTVNAADGSGTLTTPTTNVAASSTGNTLTFTYTAATGGMSNGAVRLTVPTGWSAPSTTGTAAGYTTASTGTVGVAGQVITVTGVTLAGGGARSRSPTAPRPAAGPAPPRPPPPARRPGRAPSARSPRARSPTSARRPPSPSTRPTAPAR